MQRVEIKMKSGRLIDGRTITLLGFAGSLLRRELAF